MSSIWPFDRPLRLGLARHAEAFKNVRDEHGGSGTALTESGRHQAVVLGGRIRDICDGADARLFGHGVPQVTETAAIVAAEAGLGKPILDERFRGLNLGVLGGLSRADAVHQFPDAAGRLEEWRSGRLALKELRLPDAESIEGFHERVVEGLSAASDKASDVLVLILTRSVLILITNLLTMGEAFSYENYVPYEFDPGQLSVWKVGRAGIADRDVQ